MCKSHCLLVLLPKHPCEHFSVLVSQNGPFSLWRTSFLSRNYNNVCQWHARHIGECTKMSGNFVTMREQRKKRNMLLQCWNWTNSTTKRTNPKTTSFELKAFFLSLSGQDFFSRSGTWMKCPNLSGSCTSQISCGVVERRLSVHSPNPSPLSWKVKRPHYSNVCGEQPNRKLYTCSSSDSRLIGTDTLLADIALKFCMVTVQEGGGCWYNGEKQECEQGSEIHLRILINYKWQLVWLKVESLPASNTWQLRSPPDGNPGSSYKRQWLASFLRLQKKTK